MKAYKTSITRVSMKSEFANDNKWQTEFFVNPQDALDWLKENGIDTIKDTAQDVKDYTDGHVMQFISTLKKDNYDALVILGMVSSAYHIQGEITQVTIK